MKEVYRYDHPDGLSNWIILTNGERFFEAWIGVSNRAYRIYVGEVVTDALDRPYVPSSGIAVRMTAPDGVDLFTWFWALDHVTILMEHVL